MNNSGKLVIISLVISLTIIGGGAMLISGSEKKVDRENLGTASMSLDKSLADLGTMKSEEERTAIFTITNTGTSVLRIWNVTTSCDCTFATIKIGDKEAGEFNMHAQGPMKNWMGEIPVGSKAELKAIYRPYIMPVVGNINRQVFFATNDPKNEKVTVTVEANVQ